MKDGDLKMIGIKTHYNKIAANINYVQSEAEQEVFCKKLHKVCVPQEKDCTACPYFAGLMGGYGHECQWEDAVPSIIEDVIIDWEDRYKELIRVSKLIDMGLIKKG